MKTSVWLIIGGAKHRSIRRRQSERTPGIREQPKPKFIIEAHFAGRKSLM
jgi:hypothetical protein